MPSVATERRPFSYGPVLLLGAVLVLQTFYLLASTRRLPFDYDELIAVHSSWLVSKAQVPFKDFQETHTPFFAMLTAPVVQNLPKQFDSIVTLRRWNILFSSALLGVLGVLAIRQCRSAFGKYAAVGSLLIMSVQPTVVQVLCDFRRDHLACLLILLGLVFFYESKRFSRPIAQGIAAFLFTLGLGIDIKLILVPCFAVLIETIALVRIKDSKNLTRLIASQLIGAVLGFFLLTAALWRIGVRWSTLLWQVFYLQILVGRSVSSQHGLVHEVIHQMFSQYGILLAVFVVGLIALVRIVRERDFDKEGAVLALSLYALCQPFLTDVSFKQYTFSLYLAWTLPLAVFCDRAAERWGRLPTAIGLGVLLLLSLGFEGLRWRQIHSTNFVEKQVAIGNSLLAMAPPDQPVAARPPYHPLFRADSTYAWQEVSVIGGTSTEKLMQKVGHGGDQFVYATYLRQLQTNPPSLAVLPAGGADDQYWQALRDFLASKKDSYSPIVTTPVTIYVKRPLHEN